MEKSEKIPPHIFDPKLGDDITDPNCSLIDPFCQNGSPYFPLYDRDGHGIDDKDYNIPSPPERDPGMGESFRGQLTTAQLEEYARHCDYSYNTMHGITPLLDQLREESAGWDGESEKDSGRGESESMADSFRYSNGRESVTTVVTNSSSASSSETLKWHGSLSDISVMSGQSRDNRTEQNIAHSSRVMAPQRHNSESILYYTTEKNRKSSGAGRLHADHRSKEGSGLARSSRDSRWTREVERNNEVNNLKKFPSYSYTQPLSQINEAPVAESRESTPADSPPVKSPAIDISKPPSVAERISELERQSRKPLRDQSQRYREASEPRERIRSQDGKSERDIRRRDISEPRKELRDEEEEEDVSNQCDSRNVEKISQLNHTSSFKNVLGQIEPRDASNSPAQPRIHSSSKIVDKSQTLPGNALCIDVDKTTQDQENIPNNSTVFHDDDKRPLKNFAYLDPKKQCKVPDSTLKSIQKKALLSFYERRTGKTASSSSLGSDQASDSGHALASKNSFSSKSGSNIREGRSGLSGVSLARLGRVPEPEWESPSRPPRKRSVHARSDHNKFDEPNDGCESVRSSALSESSLCSTADAAGSSPYPVPNHSSLARSSPSPPPVPPPPTSADPLLPHETFNNSRSSHVSRPSILPPSLLDDSPPPRPPERPPKKPNLRPLFPSQSSEPSSLVSGSFGASDEKLGRPYYFRRPPAPDPPTSPDSPSSQPPTFITQNRLKSTDLDAPSLLTSHIQSPFQHQFSSQSQSLGSIPDSESSPSLTSLPSSADYQGYSLQPSNQSSGLLNSLLPAPSNCHGVQASRTSTPDLPLPPPPMTPIDAECASVSMEEEPLPPPPPMAPEESLQSTDLKAIGYRDEPKLSLSEDSNSLEISSKGAPAVPNTPPPPLLNPQDASREPTGEGTYKDSYMAQKKDWKNGFEGRYTRKSSPSASPIRNPLPKGVNSNLQQPSHHPLAHHSSTKCLNSYNSTYSTLSAASMLSSSTMALTSYPSSSGSSSLSSSLSSSSSKSKSGSHLKHSVSSTSSSSNSSAGSSSAGQRTQLFNHHVKPPRLDNDNSINNNSNLNDNANSWSRQTSTTVNFTSEELRAFRSRRAAVDGLYQSNGNRTLPSAISTPTLIQPTSFSSANASSSQGSSSSLASATMDASPSPSNSLRASLDSLHCPRAPLVSKIRGSHEILPRTVSVSGSLSHDNGSLSRSISVADSLCRSSSITESSSLSRTSSICESAAPSPTVTASPLIEGSVLARPATVTEEISVPSSPEPEINEQEENIYSKLTGHETELGESVRSSPSSMSSSPKISSPVTPPARVTPPQSPVNSTNLQSTFEEDSHDAEPPLPPNSLPPEDDPPPPPPPPPDTVTIGYGRNRRPEELECDQLSMDYVSKLALDPRLQALLAPGPDLKTTADYMEGIFKFEVRKDILASRSQQRQPSSPVNNPANERTRSSDHPSFSSQQEVKDSSPHRRKNSSSLELFGVAGSSYSKSHHETGSFPSHSNDKFSPFVTSATSPVHLSSSNQVANFNAMPTSPIRAGEKAAFHFSARSMSSPDCLNSSNGIAGESREAFNLDKLRKISCKRTADGKGRLTHTLSSPGNDAPEDDDSSALRRKKELLKTSISRKLEILRAEQDAVKEEVQANQELGDEVAARVEQEAKPQVVEKFKIHTEEIDKITSLLLGLSGRLARAENALLLLSENDTCELQQMLVVKRDRLSAQLEEAIVLKQNIDKRALQLEKGLQECLSEADFANFDHFIKVKAKLVMDSREIADKIKLGEEQMAALMETLE